MPTRTDIRNQLIGDVEVKKKLQESGDDERQLHTIDYQMLAPIETSLVELSKILQMLGFQVGPVKRNDTNKEQHRFYCWFKTPSTTGVPFVARNSILMLALAEAMAAPITAGAPKSLKLPRSPNTINCQLNDDVIVAP